MNTVKAGPAAPPAPAPAPVVSAPPAFEPETVRDDQPVTEHAGHWRATLPALLGALALAAIYARAALLNLTTGVVGGYTDGYENLWDYWWLKYALFNLHQSPYYTDAIYYPTGISLRFHTLNPINGLLTLPLNLTIGYVPAINLLFVGALALTTFFGFLLIRDLVGNGWAAFAGAALFTYDNRLVVDFLSMGQAEKLSAEWIPLFFFFLFRALHGRPQWDGGRLLGRDPAHWRRDAVFATLTLFLVALTDWQYLMFTVFAAVLYFASILATRRPWADKGRIFGRLAGIGGVFALVIGPFWLWPMAQEALANPWLIQGYKSVARGLDLFDVIGPGPGGPGYLAAALALLGLWAAWRRERETAGFWAVAVLVFYVIALGPVLKLGGQETGIPLPYALIEQIPVLNIGRDPGHFNTVALLGVGVLAAFGLRALFAFAGRRMTATAAQTPNPRSKIAPWAAALIVLAVLAGSLGGFVVAAGDAQAAPPDWPPFYQQIAADPDNYAILELPLFTDKGLKEVHYQAYQVLHEKPRFGGHWARDHALDNPNNFVKTASLFRQLWLLDYPDAYREQAYPAHDFLQPTDPATQGLPILVATRVRYVVLYKDAISPDDWTRYEDLLHRVLGAGAQPYYDDAQMQVYRVPDSAPPPANRLTLDTGNGWFAAEKKPDGTIFRWADSAGTDGAATLQDSELYTMNLTPQPVPATLRFTVFAYQQPRTIQVLLNNAVVSTLQLRPEDGEKSVTLDLALPPGNNKIRFRSPEPPLPVAGGADKRLLSFGMYSVSLEAK